MDVAWRMLDGEAVLVVPMESRVIVLNATGSALWEFLETPRTREECVLKLLDEFDIDRATAEKDFDEFAVNFISKNLLKSTPESGGRK
jgi:hypothetical protein